ncbi:hypothetical protein [Thermomonospora amylolytica]|uniref:hypothetical protein n=1 Tax=Thermomonospora amylolytica TaxID=1411117 RepID=UPI001300465C|nr:hypothetical protein [Thermomonospora amylolytica]
MEFSVQTEGRMFLVADQPVQRADFESGKPKTNAEGVPLYQTRLLVMDGEGSAPIKVGIVGDPGVSQGQFVRPVGLALNVVERRGDSVMWWTVERLEAVSAPGLVPGSGASATTTPDAHASGTSEGAKGAKGAAGR